MIFFSHFFSFDEAIRHQLFLSIITSSALLKTRRTMSSAAAQTEATQASVPDDAPCIDLSALKRAKLLWPSSSNAATSSSPTPSTPPAHLFAPGAVICLYFSASWCPPCRAFSPRLAAAYEKMKAKCAANAKKSDGDGDGDGGLLPTATETFLVGFDRTRADYERYAAQMPFPAIAWDDEAGAREQLAAAASLRGIPTLLLVRGSDGRVLQEDGKTRVLRDPGLERWPWEGIKPATNILPLWAQWLALGAFYLVMKFFAKSFRGWMGW